jgi:tetratricopeptide (TPR) repeat protein
MSGPGDVDPTQSLTKELGEVARVGSKPRIIAGLPLPSLLSLASVMNPGACETIYDRAVAFVAQLETAIDGLGAGTRMSEGARLLFGLDPDTRDLTLQDRRDRAAEMLGIRGGWDSFRKGPEKRIVREVAEQLYRLKRSKEQEEESEHEPLQPKPLLAAFHQLPADVAHFTGREAELGRLRGFLVECEAQTVEILAIAGTAGVGKTALALHLSHQLAPRFPDAQLYVNLHGYDAHQRLAPAQVLDRFLRALGVGKEALPNDIDEQAALYRGLLRGKRAMVVLDNAFSADQVRMLLPASPTSLVLITSRDSLAGLVADEGAHLLLLDVLAPEEALQLLGRIAGAERLDAEPKAAAEVVRLCGYLPLAVRIAAAKLASRPGMSVAALVERLTDESRRLGELSARDVEVRTSLALSYQALDSATARLFHRLGLIAGPDFGPGVAAALIATTPKETEDLLEELVDVHLLETAVKPGRYRFHDLLRLYARELETGETSDDRKGARCRMLDWYLETAKSADQLLTPDGGRSSSERQIHHPDPSFGTLAEALAWFEDERPSLVAAIHQAAYWGIHTAAWRLADALWTFFSLRKHWADWEDTHRVGLDAARKAFDRQGQARMLTGLGFVYRDVRSPQEAIDCYQQALAICEQDGYPLDEARTLSFLGVAYRDLCRFEAAIGYLQRAVVIYRQFGHRYGEGWSLHFLGRVYRDASKPAKAVDYYLQALRIRRAIGDRYGESWDLHFLGDAYSDRCQLQEAIDCYRQALAIHREMGSRYGTGLTLDNLGLALQRILKIDEADACWREALTIFTELGAREADDVRARLGAGRATG